MACNKAVFLVSGGFRVVINPIADLLCIPREHVFANTLLFKVCWLFNFMRTCCIQMVLMTHRRMVRLMALMLMSLPHAVVVRLRLCGTSRCDGVLGTA